MVSRNQVDLFGPGLPRGQAYTPSPVVQQIVQAAPARNVVINRQPVAQARNTRPQSSLRSNPVVQELLSRAIQYYSPPPPQRTVPQPMQPNFRQAAPGMAQAHSLTPQQESQLFDQQLQA